MLILATLLIVRAWSQEAPQSKKVVTAYDGYADNHKGIMGWIGYAK